jgi:hypothetical protein
MGVEAENKTLRDNNEDLRINNESLQMAIQKTAERHEQAIQQTMHNALVSAHKKTPLVYIGRIRQEGDRTLIKIGSTSDIALRAHDLVNEFGAMRIFYVLPCPYQRNLEQYLQQHRMIKPLVFRDIVYGDRRSNGEVFAVTEEDITMILNIAKRSLFKFKTEVDRAEMQALVEKELEIQRLKSEQARLESDIALRENTVIIVADTRKYTQSRGNKIQRYSSDGKTLLETYPGCAEATRDPKLDTPVARLVVCASANKSLYKGFRWATLDRSLPDDHVQDIGETVDMTTTRQGYVAMLDLDMKEIVKVFPDQKAAAEDRKFSGVSSITNAITRGTKSGGHYFKMWFDCSQDLKDEYLANHTLPDPRVRANSKVVEQLHR